eukprot:PLAT5595.1.p2 GENE.PLAT5595.1~~PLAT5595.1.p2  ORF type:complete len:320 (+),score=187.63 PLAT5595.1:47-1006(+)
MLRSLFRPSLTRLSGSMLRVSAAASGDAKDFPKRVADPSWTSSVEDPLLRKAFSKTEFMKTQKPESVDDFLDIVVSFDPELKPFGPPLKLLNEAGSLAGKLFTFARVLEEEQAGSLAAVHADVTALREQLDSSDAFVSLTLGSSKKPSESQLERAVGIIRLPEVRDALGKPSEINFTFRDFLSSPLLVEEKIAKLQEHGKSAGFHVATREFLTYLTDKRALELTPEVLAEFEVIMKEHLGIVDATITTASELSAKDRKTIESGLKSYLEKGQSLVTTTKVDPSIVGGIHVVVGGQLLDFTVKNQLRALHKDYSARVASF